MAKRKPHQMTLDGKKQIPKMPKGYYSGDKPNPNLRAFVEQHIKDNPYDPDQDKYEVPAFNKPIKTTKATAIYNMHTYWSKKPHDAIRQYIRHYTKAGDLVLDPFCGSGGTALVALMEGSKAIAIDRSPAATFITKNYCTPVVVDELQDAIDDLKDKIKNEFDWLYETRCDRCGGKATTANTVYSQTFQCPRCLEIVPLFDCVEAEGSTKTGKPKKIKVCPFCYKRNIKEEITTNCKKHGTIPVQVSYLCKGRCKPSRDERRYNDIDQTKSQYFAKYDLGKLKEIESHDIPYWYPKQRMMHTPQDQKRWGLLWRPYLEDISYVSDFYTKRNLWGFSIFIHFINNNKYNELTDPLKFIVSSHIYNLSKMRQFRPGTCIAKGTYYTPPIYLEENVFRAVSSKANKIKSALSKQKIKTNSLMISTSSVLNLDLIPQNSTDYIFTDPPYSWKVQFGESNFLWEAWLKLDTHWHDEEIIVNQIRGITDNDWESMMRKAMEQCYRVLKPGRWISLCYHDTSEGTWAIVQDIMAEVGFISEQSDSTLYIDTGQKAWKQIVADKVIKRDLVMNFQKPKPGQIMLPFTFTGKEDEKTFREKVLSVIRKFLTSNPGSTKDRIYDEIVSRMVRNKQLESFNFDSLLSEVAEYISQPKMKDLFTSEDPDLFSTHEIKRWYLKETVDIVDEAESLLEDKVAKKLETFIKEFLEENSEYEGVHYSDLFEQYLPIPQKPKRSLAEWLIDYFYKTPDGTWRPPETDEEVEEKQKQRQTGSLRRIKTYVRLLETGTPVPDRLVPDSDQTIADWIRQARRAGLYQQGKIIFENSGLNLSTLEETDEDLAMDVNEDYRICLKRLGQKNK